MVRARNVSRREWNAARGPYDAPPQRSNLALRAECGIVVIMNAIWDDVLEPVAKCFTAEVAREIAGLRLAPDIEARLDQLAEKSNEGRLTPAEREQYEAYVDAIDLVSVLQAKARRILVETAAA